MEVELELILRKPPSQFAVQGATGLRMRAKDGLKMTACPTSVGLGLIEGKIGIRDQLIDSRAIVWRDGYARAPSKVKRVITDAEWYRERGEHGFDGLVDLARIAAIRHHHDEFISAQPEHLQSCAAMLNDLDQSVPDLHQQLISDRVSQGVVHVLELVEIEQGNARVSGGAVARKQPA